MVARPLDLRKLKDRGGCAIDAVALNQSDTAATAADVL
jgi:hypothetical protein